MPITFKEYQALAVRTSGARDHVFAPTPFAAMPVPQGPVVARLTTAALGLVGEVGEFADLLKKVVGHGHPPDPDKFRKEGGDVFWYVAEASAAFGITLPDKDADETQDEWVGELSPDPLAPGESPHSAAVAHVLAAAVFAAKFGVYYDAVTTGAAPPDTGWADDDPQESGWEQVSFLLSNVAGRLAVALDLIGQPLGQVLEANVAKLKERYPDGFSEDRSLNRAD